MRAERGKAWGERDFLDAIGNSGIWKINQALEGEKMPSITVKTTITSTYEVPDGVPLERIQHLALCELSESDDAVFDLQLLHGRSISTIFLGDEQFDSQSVEHSVTEA